MDIQKIIFQARLSLDVLEQYVKDCFSGIPTNDLPADDFSKFRGQDSFDNPEFRKLYKIKPIEDVCQVCMHKHAFFIHILNEQKLLKTK